MTHDDFKTSLAEASPPADLAPAVVALWHDAKGNWTLAHEVAQEIDDEVGAWVHAYLHRKEGDAGNAAYWYRRAGQPIARGPLDDEREAIVTALLSR
jgi:hypothetical protein